MSKFLELSSLGKFYQVSFIYDSKMSALFNFPCAVTNCALTILSEISPVKILGMMAERVGGGFLEAILDPGQLVITSNNMQKDCELHNCIPLSSN